MTSNVRTERPHILVIHHEGNVFNNPNLYDVINFLGERFRVDVLVPMRPFNRAGKFTSKNIHFVEYLPIFGDFRFMNSQEVLDLFCAKYVRAEYALIIGVDRTGLILASLLSSILGAPPYGMISYEIFFEDETPDGFKIPERDASVDLSFIVVPDQIRGILLAKENKVCAWVQILPVPVAPANSYPYRRSCYLQKRLGIPENKKILIYTGSVSNWACIDEILAHPDVLPDDWVLVIHDRFGDARTKLEELSAPNGKDKFYISDIDIPTNRSMHLVLHSADLGLALYRPEYSSMWVGKNLAHIGLSSGKTSVYLQHGLPVVITPNEIMTPLIESHGLGSTVTGVADLFAVLQRHETCPEQNQRCVKFFEEQLSLNAHKTQLMNVIERTIAQGLGQPRFVKTGFLLNAIRESLAGQQCGGEWTFYDLSRFVEELRSSGEDFVIYGDDDLGRTIQAMMPEKFIAFVDFNSNQICTGTMEGAVYAPQNLPNMAYDRLIMGVFQREPELEEFLVEKLGVQQEKIVWCFPL